MKIFQVNTSLIYCTTTKIILVQNLFEQILNPHGPNFSRAVKLILLIFGGFTNCNKLNCHLEFLYLVHGNLRCGLENFRFHRLVDANKFFRMSPDKEIPKRNRWYIKMVEERRVNQTITGSTANRYQK